MVKGPILILHKGTPCKYVPMYLLSLIKHGEVRFTKILSKSYKIARSLLQTILYQITLCIVKNCKFLKGKKLIFLVC